MIPTLNLTDDFGTHAIVPLSAIESICFDDLFSENPPENSVWNVYIGTAHSHINLRFKTQKAALLTQYAVDEVFKTPYRPPHEIYTIAKIATESAEKEQ